MCNKILLVLANVQSIFSTTYLPRTVKVVCQVVLNVSTLLFVFSATQTNLFLKTVLLVPVPKENSQMLLPISSVKLVLFSV